MQLSKLIEFDGASDKVYINPAYVTVVARHPNVCTSVLVYAVGEVKPIELVNTTPRIVAYKLVGGDRVA